MKKIATKTQAAAAIRAMRTLAKNGHAIAVFSNTRKNYRLIKLWGLARNHAPIGIALDATEAPYQIKETMSGHAGFRTYLESAYVYVPRDVYMKDYK